MKSIEILTDAECVSFLHALNKFRNQLAAVLMLDAGLRVGEVCHLLRSDLLLFAQPAHTIRILANCSKNNQSRFVPATPRIQSCVLVAQKQYWDMANDSPGYYAIHGKDPLRPLSTRQLERIFRAAGRKSLNREVWPHMLRHTFANRILKVSNLRVVQALLGHKSISSTQIYTHPNSDDLTLAIEKLDR